MPNSKQIVYLSQVQYQDLITNGSITVDGVTVQYDENDIYVTPQAEPVTDVRVDGASVTVNGVAEIPIANTNKFGVVRSWSSGGITSTSDGRLAINCATENNIKLSNSAYQPITPHRQHQSTFYGLAKASGDTTQSQSANEVGTYTPEAKGAIQQMLGVSDLIATAENDLVASKAYAIGDIFTANGKLYKATAAIAADAAIIPEVEGEEVSGANCVETSVGEGFVKFTDYATTNSAGIVKILPANGIMIDGNKDLAINYPSDSQIKNGAAYYRPLVPALQHKSVFYGLAKAAGADEKDSTLPVGQYTDTAKTAIRSMLGATSPNVIAVQDTQPTDADTKIWLSETAETPVEVPTVSEMNAALSEKVGDVQINGTSILSNGVANIPTASSATLGVVRADNYYGVDVVPSGSDINMLRIRRADSSHIKAGTNAYKPIVPANQNESVFYGLAKAAGDTTQSQSSNAVGTYTDNAKVAIRTMLGAGTYSKPVAGIPASDLASGVVPVQDVQVNGTSVLSGGVANVPIADANNCGVVKVPDTANSKGIGINSDNELRIRAASPALIKDGGNSYAPIVPYYQQNSVFYGLAKAAGDTTQSASSNEVGVYTDEAKSAIQTMLGIDLSSIASQVEIPLVETVTGAAVTITGQPNTRYMCGEVTSISITPPAAGSIDVVFTSGSTVAVLTLPSTVKMPEWFDATTLDTNTIYEILITDGVYGSVMTWQA